MVREGNMYRSKRLRVFAWLLAASALPLLAQDDIPPAAGRGGAGWGGVRGGTREFLGLGPAPDAAASARGEKLYGPTCGFCHGEKARGAEGPNLVRSVVVLDDEKGELIGPVISQGRPDKGMPAFPSFTKDQLYDLAEYLHMQVELVANRGIYKHLNVVTGDAKAGEAYFNGAGGCKTCHSPTGDLAKIGARYQPEQLQTRFIWPGGGGGGGGGSGGGNAQKVTVTLPSGETVTGALRRLDDFDISMYDSKGNYRSWSREIVKVQLEDRLVGHRELLDKYTDKDMHDLTAYLVTLK
jgi:cytochrome c oxidase cbb3-type subunit III